MSWILISALPPLLWSLNNIIDQFLARKHFSASAMAFLIMGSLISMFLGAILFVIDPASLFFPVQTIVICMALGIIFILSFWPYIVALQIDEAGLVVPLFQIVPVFVFILAWIFLNEIPSLTGLFATGLIVFAAIGFSFDLKIKTLRWKTLALMLLSSAGLSVYTVASRHIVGDYAWLGVMAWMTVGMGISALFYITVVPVWRRHVWQIVTAKDKSIFGFFLTQEILDLWAQLCFIYALAIAPAAGFVAAMNGLQPFYIFVLGAVAARIAPLWFKPMLPDKNLIWQIICMILMFAGIFMLYQTNETN